MVLISKFSQDFGFNYRDLILIATSHILLTMEESRISVGGLALVVACAALVLEFNATLQTTEKSVLKGPVLIYYANARPNEGTVNQENFMCDLISRSWQIRKIK